MRRTTPGELMLLGAQIPRDVTALVGFRSRKARVCLRRMRACTLRAGVLGEAWRRVRSSTSQSRIWWPSCYPGWSRVRLVAGLITRRVADVDDECRRCRSNALATGATCECVPTSTQSCRADAQGNRCDCQTFKGEKCTVVSNVPGSGTPAASSAPAQLGDAPPEQPDTGRGRVKPKQAARASRAISSAGSGH